MYYAISIDRNGLAIDFKRSGSAEVALHNRDMLYPFQIEQPTGPGESVSTNDGPPLDRILMRDANNAGDNRQC